MHGERQQSRRQTGVFPLLPFRSLKLNCCEKLFLHGEKERTRREERSLASLGFSIALSLPFLPAWRVSAVVARTLQKRDDTDDPSTAPFPLTHRFFLFTCRWATVRKKKKKQDTKLTYEINRRKKKRERDDQKRRMWLSHICDRSRAEKRTRSKRVRKKDKSCTHFFFFLRCGAFLPPVLFFFSFHADRAAEGWRSGK